MVLHEIKDERRKIRKICDIIIRDYCPEIKLRKEDELLGMKTDYE